MPRAKASPALMGVAAKGDAGTVASPSPMGVAAIGGMAAGEVTPARPTPSSILNTSTLNSVPLDTPGTVPAYVPASHRRETAVDVATLSPNARATVDSLFGPNNPLDPIGAPTGPTPPVSFTDIDAVKQWLDLQPPDVALVFAARAALRVVPTIAVPQGMSDTRQARRNSILQNSARLRQRGGREPTRAIVTHSVRRPLPPPSASVPPHATKATAAVAASAGAAAAAAVGEDDVNKLAFGAISSAIDAATSKGHEAFDGLLEALSTDAVLLDQRFSAVTLANSQLWPKQVPNWALENWNELASALVVCLIANRLLILTEAQGRLPAAPPLSAGSLGVMGFLAKRRKPLSQPPNQNN
jgi:hypothetical protein